MFSMIFAIVLSIVLCVAAVFFIVRSRSGKSSGSRKPEKTPISKPASKDIEHYEKPVFDSAETLVDPEIVVRDLTHLAAPSPVRQRAQADNVILDLLRNTAEIPSAILEVAEAMHNEEMHIQKLARLISTDPVLSTRILRVANSAAVAKGKVTSINTAIMLLGLNQVSILVNQILASQTIQSAFSMDREEMLGLWRHSAAVACCVRQLTLSINNPDPALLATVQTCALLHDIGKFYIKGLNYAAENESGDESLYTCLLSEIQKYGTDHCHVGFLLADFWDLPELIALTIGYHHHPAFANASDIPEQVVQPVALVAAGDYMANMLGYSDTGTASGMSDSVMESAGLAGKKIESFFSRGLVKEIKYTESLINETGQ